MKIDISMQTIQFLVLATVIAALIAGVNVAQVAHAQSKGTCQIFTQTTNVAPPNNQIGNPHCFDPEQQPPGTPIPPNAAAAGSTPGPGSVGCFGQTTTPFGSCLPESNHPQSLNPQDKVVGDPHEDPKNDLMNTQTNTLTGRQTNLINSQGNVDGNPHYHDR